MSYASLVPALAGFGMGFVVHWLVSWPAPFHREPTQEHQTSTQVHFLIRRRARQKVRMRKIGGHTHNQISRTANDTCEAGDWEECWDLDHFPRFLELPREIRDMIYELAMDSLPTRFLVAAQELSKMVVWPGTLPRLCFTSRQLHKEGIAAWIRRTRFVALHPFDGYRPLIRFLSKVEGFQDVRMLTFVEVYCYGRDDSFTTNSPQGLAVSCTGLRSLILEFEMRGLLEFGQTPSSYFNTMTGEEIPKSLGLKPLFRLHSLRHLRINLHYGILYLNQLSIEEHRGNKIVSKALKFIIENGFTKSRSLGNHVQIECAVIAQDTAGKAAVA